MRERNRAFTLVELAVVMAVIGILAACLLPAVAGTRGQAHRLTCANNLKQVGVAFRTWSAAHNGSMPMQVPERQVGRLRNVSIRILSTSQPTSRGAFKIFLCLSNELTTPKLLFCPAEYERHYRQAATTFSGVSGGPRHRSVHQRLEHQLFRRGRRPGNLPADVPDRRPQPGRGRKPAETPYLAAPNTGFSKVSLGTNFTSALQVRRSWITCTRGRAM